MDKKNFAITILIILLILAVGLCVYLYYFSGQKSSASPAPVKPQPPATSAPTSTPAPAKQTSVQIFLHNKNNPTLCRSAIPVSRKVAQTADATTMAREVLAELFRGPTAAETKQGFISFVPKGVRINSLALKYNSVIKGNIAYVDFSGALYDGLTDVCHTQGVQTELVLALLQAPTIGNVVLTIDGQPFFNSNPGLTNPKPATTTITTPPQTQTLDTSTIRFKGPIFNF